MFCTSCGAEIRDDAAFCTSCGAPVARPAAQPEAAYGETVVLSEPEAPVQPVYDRAPAQPVYNPAPAQTGYPADYAEKNKSILTKGIVGLCLSELGIPGIILGAKGLKQANALQQTGLPLNGAGRTGRILSKVGKIVGICFTVFWTLYFLIILIAILASAL